MAALTSTVSLCILRFDLWVRRWTLQRLAVTSRQVPVAAAPMSTPDAMIFIPQSPFGPTWFYLEYELEATGPKGARGKVRGYQSPLRSDDFPLLVVCRSNAVQHFERESAGLRVLVAPVNEVRRGNVVGENGTVWRYKGEPVLRLGAGPENLRP